jgi:hypothetical protein
MLRELIQNQTFLTERIESENIERIPCSATKLKSKKELFTKRILPESIPL